MQNFNDHITLTVPNHHTARDVLFHALNNYIEQLNEVATFQSAYYGDADEKLFATQNSLEIANQMLNQLAR